LVIQEWKQTRREEDNDNDYVFHFEKDSNEKINRKNYSRIGEISILCYMIYVTARSAFSFNLNLHCHLLTFDYGNYHQTASTGPVTSTIHNDEIICIPQNLHLLNYTQLSPWYTTDKLSISIPNSTLISSISLQSNFMYGLLVMTFINGFFPQISFTVIFCSRCW